jgi:hypothetical protein
MEAHFLQCLEHELWVLPRQQPPVTYDAALLAALLALLAVLPRQQPPVTYVTAYVSIRHI